MVFLFCIDVVSREILVYNRFHFDVFFSDVVVLAVLVAVVVVVVVVVGGGGGGSACCLFYSQKTSKSHCKLQAVPPATGLKENVYLKHHLPNLFPELGAGFSCRLGLGC